MARQLRSNPLALAVLACLYEKPMHPYEVAQTLRSRAKHESVRLNYGSLYAVVEGLEKRGQIHPVDTIREGKRPERTIYEITDSGARELIDWLTDLVAVPVKEYPQFEAALSFLPILQPEEALAALIQRRDVLEFRMAERRGAFESAREWNLPRLFDLEGEYHTALLDAELVWLNNLIKEITSGALDGMELWRSFHDDESISAPQLPEGT